MRIAYRIYVHSMTEGRQDAGRNMKGVQRSLVKAIDAHRTGTLDLAEQLYSDVLTQLPDDVTALCNLASIYKYSDRLEEAEALYVKALAICGDNASILHNYAGLLCSRSLFERGIELEYRAIRLTPDNSDQYTRLGFMLWKLGNLKDAITATEHAVSLDKDNWTAYLNLGGILRDLGDLKKALARSLQVLDITDGCSEAYENIGVILQQLTQPQESISYLETALRLTPNRTSIYVNLARAYYDLGSIQKSRIILEHILSKDENDAEAYHVLGSIYNEQNALGPAIVSARRAIQLREDYVEAYIALSNYLRSYGKLDEAYRVAQAGQKLDWKNTATHGMIGCLQLSQGDLKAAKESFYNAVRLHPPCVAAYFHLSQLVGKEEAGSLLEALQTLLGKGPIFKKRELIDAHFAMSNLRFLKGDYSRCILDLRVANNMKLALYGSDKNNYIQSTIELCRKATGGMECGDDSRSRIFIVGMPRSGSTLTESILSINPHVHALGESRAMVLAYSEWIEKKNLQNRPSLDEFYQKYVGENRSVLEISVDKNLYNYRYGSVIAENLKGAKIIHCVRHPLDNIVSIYRSHFANGNRYASSISDSAEILISHHEAMRSTKESFPDAVYTLNYDELVIDSGSHTKNLINWLGWSWSDKYLSPHLSKRKVNTASVIQVRSPVNSKSLNRWKLFADLLMPAVDILASHQDFSYIRDEFELELGIQ